jgi:hydrogenase maturation protease
MSAGAATLDRTATVSPTARPLIVGYGNTLRRDDGAGVLATELLEDDPSLAGVDVIAVHQLTPELAIDVGAASSVVFIDADGAGEAGAVVVRRVRRSSRARPRAAAGTSSHHVGPAELLALARELTGASPSAAVVAIGAADLGPGEGLTASVAAVMPEVVARVRELVGER